MNLTRDRLQSIGLAGVFLVCLTLFLVLTFRVNAVKSQVRLAERQIVQLKQQKLLLETEFETRANQQQLRSLNDLEFGYAAPTATQYLEGEQQLAMLGKPRGPDAPAPIMVAAADPEQESVLPAMLNPLTGKAMAAEAPKPAVDAGARKVADAAPLRERLARIERPQSVGPTSAEHD
ncbi:hypothetical protein ACOYW6_06735 [Parablastomonas sp. CN1-191]|uniref:hypothetical protein n=1 Tax=Parablastomonas sp. CN1-191 TaxID=3400908 RepID=UPI003BF7FC4A